MKIIFVFLILLFLYTAGCSEAEQADDHAEEATIPSDTITALDSIGNLMGDSCYTLGAIGDFTMFPGASPAILDRVKGEISVFDSAGVFVNRFGRFGEGPGEFQHPFSFTRLSSGIVIVSEIMGKVTAFNSGGEYLSSWTFEGMGGLPMDCIPFDDSTFVCYLFAMKMNETGFGINYSLNRYEALTGEVITEYFSWNGESNPSTDFTPAYLVAAGDGNGLIYLSRIQSDRWAIEVYGTEPEALDTLIMFPGRERIPAPDTVMVPGYLPVQYSFSDGQSEMQREFVNSPGFQPFISALGVDGNGNIWCRRGGIPADHWDVVSPEGQHLREVTAILPDSTYYFDMSVNPWGILAFDVMTEDYHKLYIMSE